MAEQPIRVLLADDDPATRKAVALTLENAGFDVVAEAANGTDAILLVSRHRPDVVLMDVWMPGVCGEDATRLIMGVWPTTRIVGLSTDESQETLEKMLSAGAVRFVAKSAPVDELLGALRAAAASAC